MLADVVSSVCSHLSALSFFFFSLHTFSSPLRPSFEEIVQKLSEYYKMLKRFYGADSSAQQNSALDLWDMDEDVAQGGEFEVLMPEKVSQVQVRLGQFVQELVDEGEDMDTIMTATKNLVDEWKKQYNLPGSRKASSSFWTLKDSLSLSSNSSGRRERGGNEPESLIGTVVYN